MRTATRLLLVLPVALAACGTPQERCVRTATKDLRTLNTLIAETEGNIARGFAYEEYEVRRTRWVQCRPMMPPMPRHPDGRRPPVPAPQMCLDDYVDTVRRPVSIDLAAERSKLAQMQAKKVELNRLAAAEIAMCKEQFPE